MAKSSKNIVYPEEMFNEEWAGSIRWFMLSDSPPERDVQLSLEGVSASFKFIQKLWKLNNDILYLYDNNPRKLLAEVSSKLNNKKPNNLIAVTGTNGKS